jgi:hypothetical protein
MCIVVSSRPALSAAVSPAACVKDLDVTRLAPSLKVRGRSTYLRLLISALMRSTMRWSLAGLRGVAVPLAKSIDGGCKAPRITLTGLLAVTISTKRY